MRGSRRAPKGMPYSTGTAKEDLTSVLSFCDLDTKQYKSHSFRIVAASDAALREFLDAQIRQMGRWRSDVFRQYVCLPYEVALQESWNRSQRKLPEIFSQSRLLHKYTSVFKPLHFYVAGCFG